MKNNSKRLFSLFLLTIVVFSVYSFVQQGQKYIGKDYFDSEDFQSKLYEFTNNIGPLLLNPIDADEAKKAVTVTENEIEEHRTRYGSLSEQIENINSQYEDRIAEAIDSKSTKVKAALIKERDAKIDDITKNFEDDEHIKAKIIDSKKRAIDDYVADVSSKKRDLLNNYRFFAFKLTDVDTQKTTTFGDVESPAAFSIKYGKGRELLESNSINTDYSSDSYSEGNSWYGGSDSISTKLEPSDIDQALIDKTYQYEGLITIPKNALQYAEFATDYKAFKANQIWYSIIWGLGLVSLVILFVNWKSSKKAFLENNNAANWIRQWSIDVRIISLLVTIWALFISLFVVENRIEYSYYHISVYQLLRIGFALVILYFILWIFLAQLVSVFEDLNSEEKRVKAYQNSLARKAFEKLQDLFLNRSIGFQSVMLLGIMFLGGLGLAGSFLTVQLFLIYIPLFLFILLPATLLFLTRMSYLNRIMKETEQMAAGRLSNEIKIQGKSALATHAKNLNDLRDGVRTSISEQAKSERLKTELITNVSHDLRTPLTSIITYTDLLKKPNVTEEERHSYIAILDKKSQRLKTLIEDLFEVSKMASGNIELQKQRVDLNQLLQQALAEHEEDITKSALDFRVNTPEGPLFANVDGQKWWRVLDNLIVNTLKYALEGTRVYVTLRQHNGEAEFVIKNVTKYEIGENVEELYERFKRADASRHTDGSGLGLAIAQSIVDLHAARMKIEVDGDLFKVTVNVVSVY
ncbi:histidine kinase dimerization/phospho-acceptor domain-containing protein [Viridibacillus sp. NPDC093762]|uniref:sensor histidine kinase n=1 Tax=Viridibacillus sp. NPDC093762 TaxID=3390720 RepID=UPI003D08EEEE